MPIQINLANLKISTVDKAVVNIGPTLNVITRARQRQNQGNGEINGDYNMVDLHSFVEDGDVIDVPFKKEALHLPRGLR